MKRCSKCKQEKELTEFYKLKRSGDGLQSQCKQCANGYYKAEGTMEKYKVRVKKQQQGKREWLTEYKLTVKCQACDESDPCCIDFHHLDPTTKEFAISNMMAYSAERIEQEIAKCVPLCRNCHSKVHAGVIPCPASVESDTSVS